jgi:hypothetical protein
LGLRSIRTSILAIFPPHPTKLHRRDSRESHGFWVNVALRTAGTPEQVSMTLTRDGATLASGSARPNYAPDECGFVEPTVTLR